MKNFNKILQIIILFGVAILFIMVSIQYFIFNIEPKSFDLFLILFLLIQTKQDQKYE